MCGIAGYVGSSALDGERIRRTLELMDHRGPDDGTHRAWDTPDGRRVELLHTRLTIIDLDPRSNQPMQLGDRWIAFNGELYNYVEVRARLVREGVSFRTESDTEVLLAALAHGGTDALDGCEGMWAFATYDEGDGTLTLSRDRFGEKPLYLLRDGDDLYFGSEAKFVFALLGRTPPVNIRQLQRYLVTGYKSLYKSGDTFFEGLEELEAGTVLEVVRGGEQRRRAYWEVPEVQEQDMSFEEAVAGAREHLIRSVELRLRADVPLAFCMSGGVDSLSLISIARNVFDYDVHGFTIVNSDERYEEQAMVEHAIERLGIRHTAIPLDTDGFLPRLRELVRHHDAPVYTITYFVQWLLMQSIHEHGYRVSISGTAADELYSGYYDHHLAYLREVAGQPELALSARRAWTEHVQPIVRNPYLRDPDLFVRDPSFRGHIYLGAEEFATYLTEPFSNGFTERAFTPNVLRNRMLNELFAEAVPVILHEDDLNAMYFSIENRSPFLDRALFEHSLSVPTRHLVQDGKAKAVLREAMRGIAPDLALDNRRKVGFNAPIHSLLDVNDPAIREELLADSPVFEHVRRDKVAELLDKRDLPNSESKMLFNVLNAKLFLEEVA
ncbi:MAG: asparagine synthase (glutamine-hydrolyzing) [Solirubrobacteraceae bacterium]